MHNNQPLGLLSGLGRMAYALLAGGITLSPMRHELAALPPQVETIAELRELYRAAEGRAARMRLLVAAGQELASADAANIGAVLQHCADRLAYFLGRSGARYSPKVEPGSVGVPVPGLSRSGNPALAGSIAIEGLASIDQIDDPEDRATCGMYLELMGATADRIARDAERSRLLAALTDREQRLEQVVSQLFSAQEEERRRVSHELHDGVAQTATALVRMLEGPAHGGGADLPAAERTQLAAIARDLVTELRALIGGLRPTLLDDLGLKAALQALGDSLQQDGFHARVALDRAIVRLPATVETALFRVAQEAVANVRKHAGGPCAVTIELKAGQKGQGGFLRICDSGQGLDPARDPAQVSASGNHVGIAVMRERMAAIGGRLDWRAGEGGGVCVTALLPEPEEAIG